MSFDTAAAQEFLAHAFAPWVQALNLTVDEIGQDEAILSMPITDDIARIGGIVCGQSLATMADTAMVIASAGHYGQPRPVATTNLDTQFLRPGSGTRVRCTARVRRAGKAMLFAQADMHAQPDDKLIASATATFFVPPQSS
ncbi:MAG: PaaI family thioesterase [Sediminimonas sp.]|uniref:PaaI family thioesterase n=1 Tax=Sediminimonas sp. TaxID=2823379 RepID=UPI00287020BB|nr:PaaI family thioesterase [Sediminimonas sp.]MDR9486306.1 PaaI family thioesterase [Sediminimonas sp.]